MQYYAICITLNHTRDHPPTLGARTRDWKGTGPYAMLDDVIQAVAINPQWFPSSPKQVKNYQVAPSTRYPN